MKTCFKCLQQKPLAEFYRHKQMADGHLNKCKDCAKADVSANYRARVDYYAAYDSMRDKTPERRASTRESRRRYYSRNKAKLSANTAFNHAVQRHGLVRQPCEVCGALPTDGHHDDYSKPLEVRWLCRTHHLEVHGKKRRTLS